MRDEPRLVVQEAISILVTDDEEIFQVGGVWPPGTSGASYLHNQAAPDTVWTVNHNLGFRPNVEIRNAGGQVILADVAHITDNQLKITFAAPTAGTARVI